MASSISAGTTSSTALVCTADTTGALQLATNNGTVAVTIDTSQRVGVNVASPIAPLCVTGGTSNASSLATAYSLSAFTITPKSSSGYSLQFGSGPSDSPYIQMSAGGAAAGDMTIQPYGGNVGIGTTSPSVKLNITDATSSVVRANQTTNGTDVRMVANASGAFVGSYAGTSINLVANSATVATIDTNAVFSFNSGYGSVGKAYGCRAWVMFNGSNGSIFAQGNVSSVTRNGTGQYVVNYSTAMPDASYSVVSSCSGQGSVNGSTNCMLVNASAGGTNVTPTTTTTALFCFHPGNQVAQDTTFITVAVFR
jgi:hypothetical protein